MKHLDPKAAYAFLCARPDAVFIDCRSEAEYFLVGHPVVERLDVRPHHARERALVGDRQRLIADLARAAHQFFGRRGTAQEREVRDAVQFAVARECAGCIHDAGLCMAARFAGNAQIFWVFARKLEYCNFKQY